MRTLCLAVTMGALAACTALAASNGNFSAMGTNASCAIGTGGTFGTPGGPGGGTALGQFTANLSTSNGNGLTLDIRPDLVTGLFTDTKISTTVPSATADVGIQVCVTVDGSGANVFPTNCVIYDERFQQISSQLFSQLTACTAAPTGALCSSNNTTCAAGSTCTLGATGTCTISGAACSATSPCTGAGDTCNFAGQCTAPNPLCNFDLILSTLSAHSFDFIVSMPGVGPHKVVASWSVVDATANNSNSTVAACAGPGVLTVTQYKVFQNSGALTFSSL